MGGTSEYRIAVAIADPANAAQLTRTAVDIARERDGEVLVLRVLVTERQSPFALYNDDVIIREFGGEEQEILDRVVETARGAVPVSGQLLVSFDVARALTNAVVEFDCDALLVGWQARERPSEIVLGSNIDRLVARTPSDVLVEKIGPADGVDSILVPVAEGPHAELAADVARAIAVANDAEINLLRVGAEDTTAERLLAGIAARVAPADVDREVRTGSVTDTVVEEASNHDITILGSTRQGMLRRQLVGSVPQAVGRRADTTVIITRREVGIRPRLTRLVRETL
ncbi:amino acid transporter [Haladaptatus sp. R4]|uniref:universal stress protein n=1 Tax=Haladaptatus sp. R4 TaxID=1679489 RepID=UPI0007B47BF0|nr:universal stress protein [Haladaptatus sp. R4]KZN25020.1 amino acid transporter [Haladaptatus sp. R4]